MAKLHDTGNPMQLYQESCDGEPEIIPLSKNGVEFTVLARSTPTAENGINLEIAGTLLYGTVVFTNVVDEAFCSLSENQIRTLECCTAIVQHS